MSRVLMLLDDPGLQAELSRVLRTGDRPATLVKVATLDEAMVASASAPVDLAVLDPALCESLEREFVGHLLGVSPHTCVMLAAESTPLVWRSMPGRLSTVRRELLVQAVSQWQRDASLAPHKGGDAGVAP